MITALSRVMDGSVGSFLGWTEFFLGRVFGCWGDFAQDKIPYVKSFEFHSPIVILSHLLLILRHFMKSSVSDLIQAIQVDPQLSLVPSWNVSHLMLVIPTSIGITASMP